MSEPVRPISLTDTPKGVTPMIPLDEHRGCCVDQHLRFVRPVVDGWTPIIELQLEQVPHDGNLHHFPIVAQRNLTSVELRATRTPQLRYPCANLRVRRLRRLVRVLDSPIADTFVDDTGRPEVTGWSNRTEVAQEAIVPGERVD